jgi:hypothetical protein
MKYIYSTTKILHFVRTALICVRSKERCSYRHLAGTIQKARKITENTKCGNEKLGVLLCMCLCKIISHCSSVCHQNSLDKRINVINNQIFVP